MMTLVSHCESLVRPYSGDLESQNSRIESRESRIDISFAAKSRIFSASGEGDGDVGIDHGLFQSDGLLACTGG